MFDVTVAVVALIVTTPLWLSAALATRALAKGVVLHRARRVGLDGKEFTLYKFRSMHADAVTSGPAVSRRGDPRVTRVGRVLRRTKIDELPQLLNVLRGDMSIVGPRPEDPSYVACYTPEQRRVLDARPGLTSPASVRYRNEEALLAADNDDLDAAYRRILTEKLAIDLHYLEHRTVWTDLRVVLQTLRRVITG